MGRVLILVAAAWLVGGAPQPASANEQGAAAGAVTGAVAGAVVGGPIGAVVGAVVGGVAGGAATAETPDPSGEAPAVAIPNGGGATPVNAVPSSELTTGSIIETTCTRDPQGTPRCRRQVVR